MRRFLFGVVIASVSAAMPSWALGGDREIAEGIMTQLQQAKSQGVLKGFDLDLKVESGVVYLTGNVRSPAQHAIVVEAVERTGGVAQLVDKLQVSGEGSTDKRTSESADARGEFSLSKAVKLGPSESTDVVPASADEAAPSSSDVAITDSIIGKLQQQKQAGALKGFDLDVTTTQGTVALRGKVASPEQKALVLDIARRIRGVRKVVDDVAVASAVRQASSIEPSLQGVPAVPPLQPVPQVASMPVVGSPATPRPFAPAMVANMQGGVTNVQTGEGCYVGGEVAGGTAMGTPVPMQAGGGVAYGMGAPRYDQPYMPSYAWPSYAAYPNYAAVTYPKQYSPSAWPYIGPFYPYPQVPLGWRKVALEWDDGLWYLDFTSK
ncbi:MAG: BON domain-containing protein [Aureliella sp.]